ncbi:MAG: PLP-dependent aminotransferase family protein [Rhodothermales bacterium]
MDDLDLGKRTVTFRPGEQRHQAVYQHLRDRILSGHLRPAQQLPPTRTLAEELGVARGTVTLAYEHLKAEGYAEARVGSGTFVADVVLPSPASLPQRHSCAAASPRSISQRAQAAIRPPRFEQGAGMLPFRVGTAPLDLLPRPELARIAARIMRSAPMEVWGYGPAQGELGLREALAAYLRTARGLAVDAEQIIITAGTQQALWLIAQVLADPDDAVWAEDPGYAGAVEAFEHAGLRVASVPVDDEGLSIARGAARAPNARLAYVTPTHQFPTGATLSLARRLELLQWAEAAGAWIIEDDYDGAFWYRGAPLEPLYTLDASARVLYVGSLSKMLSPAFRIGFLVAPPDLVAPLVHARTAMDRHPPTWMQHTVATFIEEGHFGRHVRRLRKTGFERQHALLDAAEQHFGAICTLAPSDTGLHLVGHANDPAVDDVAMAYAAQAAGLHAKPLSVYYRQEQAQKGWLFGYAPFASADLRWAAQRLAKVWGAIS